MKRSRFSEEAIIRILDDARSGKTVKELCAEHNIRVQTLYNWKRKYGVGTLCTIKQPVEDPLECSAY